MATVPPTHANAEGSSKTANSGEKKRNDRAQKKKGGTRSTGAAKVRRRYPEERCWQRGKKGTGRIEGGS